MLAAVRHMVHDPQISAPFGRYSYAVGMLEASGTTQAGDGVSATHILPADSGF